MLLNQDAEQSALAGIIKFPDAYWTIVDDGLTAKDFMLPLAHQVMQAIEKVAGDRKQPELLLITEELSDSPDAQDYINKLLGYPVSVPQAIEAATIVKGLSTSRQLQQVGAAIITLADEHRSDSGSAVAEAEGLLRRVRSSLPVPDRSPDPADILARLSAYRDTRSVRIQFSPTLNNMVHGLQPGHLWVLGGFSSTGKSAAVINFIYDTLRAKKWVGVWSLEMTQEQYLIRLLSLATGINQNNIRDRAFFGHDDVDMMRRAEGWVQSAPIRVYDTSYRLSDIRSKAIAQKETVGLDLFVVDFIQNVHDSGDEIKDARTTILELQNLSKELDCTVMALSQVSNEMAKWEGDKNFYSFKGHGAIRDAADVAVMLKRDRLNSPGIMDFHVMKHRHGEFGNIQMNFDLRTGKLSDAYGSEGEDM